MHDVGAECAQQLSDAEANSGRTAGDERDLTVEESRRERRSSVP